MIKMDYSNRKTFFFGEYPQGENGEVKPIEWIVLKEDDRSFFLLSKYALDCKEYFYMGRPWNEMPRKRLENVVMTWEQSSLRKWLNNEFLDTAFTSEEQKRIRLVTVRCAGNAVYTGITGGNNTTDKVYLLSYAEAQNNLKGNSELACESTPYAEKQRCLTTRGKTGYKDGLCYTWWLRTVGHKRNYACTIQLQTYCGFEVSYMGEPVWWHLAGVRPAIRIFKEAVL